MDETVEAPTEETKESTAPTPETDAPDTKPSDASDDGGEEKTLGDELEVEAPIAEEAILLEEQQKKDSVLDVMRDWGVDENLVNTFAKQGNRLDFSQFVDRAVGLFPEINDVLGQLKAIDDKETSDFDKDNEKAVAASHRFNNLAEKMGLNLTEGQEKIANLALSILAVGGENLAEWFGEGFQNSDLGRLIDAIVMAADYNSAAALGKLEREGENVASSKDFFNYFTKNNQAIPELLKIDEELGKKLNWTGGGEILKKAQNKDGPARITALTEYFKAMYEKIASSPAQNLVWQQANLLMAKEVFKKEAISSAVLEDLEKMHKDNLSITDFGTK